jgi:hypothetical protein
MRNIFFSTLILLLCLKVYSAQNEMFLAKKTVKARCHPRDRKMNCSNVKAFYLMKKNQNKFNIVRKTYFKKAGTADLVSTEVILSGTNNNDMLSRMNQSCNDFHAMSGVSWGATGLGMIGMGEFTGGLYFIFSEVLLPALDDTTEFFCGADKNTHIITFAVQNALAQNSDLYDNLDKLFQLKLREVHDMSPYIAP